MKTLKKLLQMNKTIRVIGFDDAPFKKERGSMVNVSGIICSQTRFEGMLWGTATKDGLDATDTIIDLLQNSKFLDQISVVLTDGIAIGGFNIIDLNKLAETLDRPCIAVMRKQPDLVAIDRALQHFDDYEYRKQLIQKAGEIYQHHPFYYQIAGCDADIAGKTLERLTDTGNVPEALRLAHLIGSAVMTGQSSQRA